MRGHFSLRGCGKPPYFLEGAQKSPLSQLNYYIMVTTPAYDLNASHFFERLFGLDVLVFKQTRAPRLPAQKHGSDSGRSEDYIALVHGTLPAERGECREPSEERGAPSHGRAPSITSRDRVQTLA